MRGPFVDPRTGARIEYQFENHPECELEMRKASVANLLRRVNERFEEKIRNQIYVHTK